MGEDLDLDRWGGEDARFDLAVFIGRMQGVTKAHERCMGTGLDVADTLLNLLGSSSLTRTRRNPLLAHERAALVRGCMDASRNARMEIVALPDRDDDDAWAADVRGAVLDTLIARGLDPATARVVLVGHSKDASSYYLRMFPEWASAEVANVDGLNATDLREAWYADPLSIRAAFGSDVAGHVLDFMEAFATTADYAELVAKVHAEDAAPGPS